MKTNENETQPELIPAAEPKLEKVRGLQVDVTDKEIDTAVPANSGHCMVSDAVHACARARKWKIGKVLTDLQTVRFSDLKTGTRYICFTPRVAQEALLAFDQGIKPEPFGFRLKPVQVIPKGAPRKQSAAKLVPRRKNHATGGPERPIKHGGPALPHMVGLRRGFGLRRMGVWQPPTPATAETVTA